MVRLLALLMLAIAGTAPEAAVAATAAVNPARDPETARYDDEVTYLAAPGERNDLHVRSEGTTSTGVTAWVLRDSGAVIAPGNLCASLDAHTVRCTRRPPAADGSFRSLEVVRAELGDLDDATAAAPSGESDAVSSLSAHGGSGADRLSTNGGEESVLEGDAGDDVLSGGAIMLGGVGNDQLSGGGQLYGGPGDDTLTGGAAGDTLNGGGGRDRLLGGPGSDRLDDGDRSGQPGAAGPGPDVMDGGDASDDVVTYEDRRRPVLADLAEGRAGEAGEGDVLGGLERVIGGTGDDQLAGTDAPNLIDGRRGSDRLVGRGGDDTLLPGSGSGEIGCGRGQDTIHTDGTSAVLRSDCETVVTVGTGLVLAAHPVWSRRGGLIYRVGCPEIEDPEGLRSGRERCSGTVTLREAEGRGRLLATGRLPRGRWKRRRVLVALTPLGERLMRRRSGVRAGLRVALGNRAEVFGRARWTIRLIR